MITESFSELLTIKVVLVGESGTGKTSIINNYCSDYFSEETTTTIGSSKNSKILLLSNKMKLKLDIWDTAGQEMYRSLNKLFYKDAKIVLFIYDITNLHSFNEIVNYWYQEVKSNVDTKSGKFTI